MSRATSLLPAAQLERGCMSPRFNDAPERGCAAFSLRQQVNANYQAPPSTQLESFASYFRKWNYLMTTCVLWNYIQVDWIHVECLKWFCCRVKFVCVANLLDISTKTAPLCLPQSQPSGKPNYVSIWSLLLRFFDYLNFSSDDAHYH